MFKGKNLQEEANKQNEIVCNSKFMKPDEYSETELAELEKFYEESFNDIVVGEIVAGRIVGISEDHIVLDVGFKKDGTIHKNEFSSHEELVLGGIVDIVIESVEDEDGNLVLSKKRADLWNRIIKAHDTEEVVQGKILKRIKGGLIVDFYGLEAFLPGSQIDIPPIKDFDAFVDKEMDFRVIEVNVSTQNIVVSHKVVLEEINKRKIQDVLSKVKKGLVLKGKVKSFTDFGIFIDLGGVDGLIRNTVLSTVESNYKNDVLKLNDIIEVIVEDFDIQRKRIYLKKKS